MNGWANSTRRARLPKDWTKRRARILKRDPLCRIAGPTCTSRSTEVDHVIPSDDHSDSNLQGLCAPCHQAKTLAERPRPASRRRTPETHPALRSRP